MIDFQAERRWRFFYLDDPNSVPGVILPPGVARRFQVCAISVADPEKAITSTAGDWFDFLSDVKDAESAHKSLEFFCWPAATVDGPNKSPPSIKGLGTDSVVFEGHISFPPMNNRSKKTIAASKASKAVQIT